MNAMTTCERCTMFAELSIKTLKEMKLHGKSEFVDVVPGDTGNVAVSLGWTPGSRRKYMMSDI
jgi:hypothetical protein